jgi:tRNA (guanine37-N1)-methyltransferase
MKKILNFTEQKSHNPPRKISLQQKKLPFLKRKKSKIPQDVIGDIAILKFPRKTLWLTRKLKARKFLKENKTIKTVLEKTGSTSGRLRTQSTKHLAGKKTKETTYKENGCIFKFNVDETYFSPRLSNERKVIAEEVNKLVKKKEKILVMFAGISPYPIVIAKTLKQNGKKANIISNELNRKANEQAKKIITLNKLQKEITLIGGDAKKLPEKIKEKQDIILMPRPNLKDTFLKTALKLSKKGTTIFYHGFGTEESVLKEIKKDTKGKIGKIKIRKAGDIGPRIYRWQAQFKVK